MEKLHFVTLMDTSKFIEYSKKSPTEAFSNLNKSYHDVLTDMQRLQHVYIQG